MYIHMYIYIYVHTHLSHIFILTYRHIHICIYNSPPLLAVFLGVCNKTDTHTHKLGQALGVSASAGKVEAFAAVRKAKDTF